MNQTLIVDILQAEIEVGKRIKQHQNNLKQYNEFNIERAFEQLKKFSLNSFNNDLQLTQLTLKNTMGTSSVQGIAYKGVIDFERLIALYRLQDELVTQLELQSIIQRYSSAANQGLDYDAFLRMIGQNLADTKRKNLIFDSSNSTLQSSKNGNSKTLSERVMQSLSSIFLLELDLLRFTEVHKVSLKNNFSFEPISFFPLISFNSQNLISFEHLQQFFRRNKQELSKEDYAILLSRVKKSKLQQQQRDDNNNSAYDECITQQEFVQLTVPQLPYNSALSMAQLRASQSQGNLEQSGYQQASQQLTETKTVTKAVQFQEGSNAVLRQAIIANIPVSNNVAANKISYGIPVIPVQAMQANQQQLRVPQQQQQVQSSQPQLSSGVLYIPPSNAGYYPVQQLYANNNVIAPPQYVLQQNLQQQQIPQQKEENVTININNRSNATLEAQNDVLKTDNENLKQENSSLQQKILRVQQLEQLAKEKEILRAEIIAEQKQLLLTQQQEQQQLQAKQQQQLLQTANQQLKPNSVVVQPQQQYQIVGNIPAGIPYNQGFVQKQQLPYQQQLPQVILNQGGLVATATFAKPPIALAPAMATSLFYTPQQPSNSQIIANQLVTKTSSSPPPPTAALPEYILNSNQAPSFLVGGQQFNNRPVLENAPFARGSAPHYNTIQGDLREAINNQFGPPQQPPFILQQNSHGFW